jgi:hypothetical protein
MAMASSTWGTAAAVLTALLVAFRLVMSLIEQDLPQHVDRVLLICILLCALLSDLLNSMLPAPTPAGPPLPAPLPPFQALGSSTRTPAVATWPPLNPLRWQPQSGAVMRYPAFRRYGGIGSLDEIFNMVSHAVNVNLLAFAHGAPNVPPGNAVAPPANDPAENGLPPPVNGPGANPPPTRSAQEDAALGGCAHWSGSRRQHCSAPPQEEVNLTLLQKYGHVAGTQCSHYISQPDAADSLGQSLLLKNPCTK